MLTRIRGTRDILDARPMHHLITIMSHYFQNACFVPIQLPTIELCELFQKSLGQASDAVSKEMYLVKTIHENSENICLRPEFTASAMRAYLLERPEVKPWKVFTYGSAFRHERPQKGRYREFYQFSIEIIEGVSYLYDVELLSLMSVFFKNVLGIQDFELKINFIGTFEDRQSYKNALKDYIHSFNDVPSGILALENTNILRILDLKDEACKQFMIHAPSITDYLSSESADRWQSIKNALEACGVSYTNDCRLVRGLDYYTDTVFEFTSHRLGAQNAFAGGGRYDGLAQILGNRDNVSSLGAAIGIDRLLLLLEDLHLFKDQVLKETVVAIATKNEYALPLLSLVLKIRDAGISVDIYNDKTSLKSGMRKADNDKAAYVIIWGEAEDAANCVSIKDMKTGAQESVKMNDVVAYLKRRGI